MFCIFCFNFQKINASTAFLQQKHPFKMHKKVFVSVLLFAIHPKLFKTINIQTLCVNSSKLQKELGKTWTNYTFQPFFWPLRTKNIFLTFQIIKIRLNLHSISICSTLGSEFEFFSEKSLWYPNLAHCAVCVCLSASANFLMVAYIKECQNTKLTYF